MEHPRISIGTYTHQGSFHSIEDRYQVIEDLNSIDPKIPSSTFSFFGIYDGHGGVTAVEYVLANLHQEIVATEEFHGNSDGNVKQSQDLKEGLTKGFLELDKKLLQQSDQSRDASGSCGIVSTAKLINNRLSS